MPEGQVGLLLAAYLHCVYVKSSLIKQYDLYHIACNVGCGLCVIETKVYKNLDSLFLNVNMYTYTYNITFHCQRE